MKVYFKYLFIIILFTMTSIVNAVILEVNNTSTYLIELALFSDTKNPLKTYTVNAVASMVLNIPANATLVKIKPLGSGLLRDYLTVLVNQIGTNSQGNLDITISSVLAKERPTITVSSMGAAKATKSF